MGVDTAAKAVILEQRGGNRGYRENDVRGFRPERGVCVPDGPEVIESRVDMKAVRRRAAAAAVEGVGVLFSRDAGRCVGSRVTEGEGEDDPPFFFFNFLF